MYWPKVTLFGDSITHRSFDVDYGCWGSMLANRLSYYFDVDVRGFGGYNTRWALGLMPEIFPRDYLARVELMIIFFGHNDSNQTEIPLHVPVQEYESNLRLIVKYLLDNGLTKENLILISPGYYHREDYAASLMEQGLPECTKTSEDVKKYSEAVLRITEDYDISSMNFFEKTSNHEPLRELFHDGIHLSRKGAELLFNNLFPIVEDKIQKKYNKKVEDLWHVTPYEQRAEVADYYSHYRKKSLAQPIDSYQSSSDV